MKSANPQPRVMTIGLDGATFDLIDPWLKQGYLENMRRLISRGSRATLNSVILPFTPQAWGSFMTGMNPGRHGVFGFKEKPEGSYAFQLVNNKSIKSKTLQQYLSEHGREVILVNIPMTYPPEKVSGIIIGGMDSPGVSSDFTFPADVKNEIFRVVKDYVIHLHVGAGYLDSDEKRRKAAANLIRMVDCREQLVLYLMDKYPWDFFTVNFTAIDQVQHHFWKYLHTETEFSDIILNVYQRVDRAVGEIIRHLPQDTSVIMMSDHGAGPASPYVFFLDEWLRQQGLLKYKNSLSVRGWAGKLSKLALAFLSQKLSSDSKDALMRWLPGMRQRSQGFIRRGIIDWPNSSVFSGEHPATLRINLKNREPEGCVDVHDYERFRNQVIKDLEAVKHPVTHERMIKRVYKKEELYAGDYLADAPDLIIESGDFSLQFKGGPAPSYYRGQVIADKNPKEFFVNGVHRLNGIFVASGPGVKENYQLAPLNITDLFPTILYLLRLKIPRSLDGKVAGDIFEKEFLSVHPICKCEYPMERWDNAGGPETIYKQAESAEIEASLRGLGYID